MACPICEKRKAKRFCPARGESICSVCCGTEREVTIDCPSDCPYLQASRQYDFQHRTVDRAQLPFADVQIPSSFVAQQEKFLLALSYAICLFARDQRPVVDADVLAALQALAEAYRTRESGLYYEKPPDYRLQRELYDRLKAAVDEFRKSEAQQLGFARTRDKDVRDSLIFLTQLGALKTNGRPKSRSHLDFLRTHFKSEALETSASKVILLD